MRIIVTGGAGFIGSTLVDVLLESGHSVTAVDNLSTGNLRFLEVAERYPAFELVQADLYTQGAGLAPLLEGADFVFHLAANADIRFGWDAPDRDINQNVIVTHHVLEAMKKKKVARIIFASTGSVYGEAALIPTPEDCPFPIQTSLYGASKLAAEGLIAAYAEGCDISATVFRFVSILGPRYTHGHVVDFLRQLLRDPSNLTILGNGEQRKSYLDVTDCVAALVSLMGATHKFEVFNLGADDYCTVNDSVRWIAARLGVSPELRYTGGDRGWVGDNPFIYLATDKIRATGWAPRYTIREAIERTVDYLLDNRWILERLETRARD